MYLEGEGILTDCVWYGECNTDERGHIQNCPYSGPAKQLEDPVAIKTLLEYCPEYIATNDSGNISTCCGADQLRTFVTKMSIVVSFLGRCPSCFRSFLNLYCSVMCNPEQSTFMKIIDTATNNQNDSYITDLQIYVSEDYINGTFDSCKQVMMSTTGQLVLDLMCGSWGAEKCTPQRLFSFMGTRSEYVPFTIQYITKIDPSSSYKLISPATIPCYQALDNSTVACSCTDCKESCPLYTEFEGENEDEFMLEYYLFAIMLVSLLFAVLVYKTFPVQVLFYLKNQGSTDKVSLDAVTYREEQKEKDISCGCRVPCKSKLEICLQDFFTGLGEICATHPWKILFLGLFLITCTTIGIKKIDLTIDPVELWTTNGSRCREERQYFNQHFGPFYRIQQVIVTAKNLNPIVRNTSNGEQTFGPAFHRDFLMKFKAMQDSILKLGGAENGLQNICVAPLADPGAKLKNTKKCLVMSVWSYFKNNLKIFERVEQKPDGYVADYLDQIKICTQNSMNPNCLGEYGGPVDPAAVFGGFLDPGENIIKSDSFIKATSLTLNILVQNHLNKSENEAALRWEQLFVDFMKNFSQSAPDNMTVSFFSERSVEDEINRESKANAIIVTISYLAMFLYISITLGRFQFVYQFLYESKIVVGFAGVLLVFSSVVASVGINSFFGVSVTLIALEVVPFLVLAVGVDNIFILVHAFEKEPFKKKEPFEKYVGRILGKVGPSILLTGASESGCFFLGAISPMPCIKSFALYAAVALLINFILQLTCFVSVITLDYRRRMDSRMDIFCWVKVEVDKTESTNFLKSAFENFFTPFVLNKFMRPLIILAFFGWHITSVLVLPNVGLGLEQHQALPSDSYVKNFLKDLNKNIAIGAPVYFIVTGGLDLSNPSMQNLLCNGLHCDSDSITNQIYAASRNPSKTTIAKPSSSWIDDYFSWLQSPGCCVEDAKTNGPCTGQGCKPCEIVFQKNGRPKPEDFNKHLSKFLSMNPSMGCVKGGRAAYGQGVKYRTLNDSVDVGPYYFMTYHKILRTSEDFYTAVKESRKIADSMTKTLRSKTTKSDIRVMPYSIFHIFYEQYLTIWKESIKSLSLSLLTIFIIVFVLTYGNLTASVIVLLTVTMIVVDMLALLYFLNIQLNALSLVNIVMSIGIAVEFCCHIVRHFCVSNEGTRLSRARWALNNVGPSIFSGITTTKFIGISVLYFAPTEVFRIYFFQMYLGVVVIGALHGLVFLPVVLSYLGPFVKKCNTPAENMNVKYDVIDALELKNDDSNSLTPNNEGS
ncbi:hypothetical protein V9T40_003118 [Parthenolecanium corni]|uniref:SSD domain-containing protein n=1 Tax=Parthenolecanium corni TaxID=536013 RepID=A0AAN9U0R0_9HEMI